MTFFWRATQFASALFLVAVGIWEMYDNWQLYPWYFISLLGLYSLLSMQTDRWVENDKLKRKQKEWN